MSIVYAFIGIIIFAFGGLISSKNWDNISKEKTNNRKRYIFFFLFGIILLLIGGFLSTYYWNKHFREQENKSQRATMIYVLTAELMTNMNIYEDGKFREPNDGNLSAYVVFPKFRVNVLQDAISSGLFISTNDKELFTIMSDVYDMLLSLNERIDITHFQMLSNSSPDSIRSWRIKLRDGNTMRSVAPKLNRLGDLLLLTGAVNEADSFYIDQ